MNLLLADDHLLTAKLLRNYLINKGFLVDIVKDGFEVMNYLKDNKAPHILILDLVMPGLDGFETLEMIRNNSKYNSLKVVIFSVNDSKDTIERVMNMGAAAFISKNSKLSIMENKIKEIKDQMALN